MISSSACSSRLSAIALVAGALGCASAAGGLARLAPEWRQQNVVVLPCENLSGEPAPLKAIQDLLVSRLRGRGLAVRDRETVDAFMAAHRLRFTGGLDEATARAVRAEIQAKAVLVTTVAAFQDADPCRIELFCRLVGTGDVPTILWSGRVALSGDERPGLLGLGLVQDPKVLGERAVDRLLASLGTYLSGSAPEPGGHLRVRPRLAFRSGDLDEGESRRVAVLPFANTSARRGAGELVLLNVVNELAQWPRFTVVEPGVVRQKLLNARFIMNEGLSASDVNVLGNSLGADLIVSGTVRELEDRGRGGAGQPKADLSIQVADVATRKMVWSSRSYGAGRDGVYLFDWGAVDAVGTLVSGMVRAVAERLATPPETPEPAPAEGAAGN